MKTLLREPLFYFLIAGACLFAADSMFDTGSTINIRSSDLEQLAGKPTSKVDEAQLAVLAQSFAEQEALFRSGEKLGLIEQDNVIRKRVIQQMEFLGSREEIHVEPSTEQLQAFYNENSIQYKEPARITFSQVFSKQSEQHAHQLLEKLNDEGAAFNDATAYGDRFLYHSFNVDRNQEQVTDHFGEHMANELFHQQPANKWLGVFKSDHGFHAVMITKLTEERIAPLAESLARVRADYRAAQLERQRLAFIERTLGEYEVTFDSELESRLAPKPR